ncbi:MAG: hypothetical protein JXA62_05235, partial [Candidatus Aminicenantes bacterium]|nr:hypothetical protein [Candidatus Aminicenantes bacterium]
MEHVKRDIQIPEEHFFLFGPRGTGKSTLLKKNIPDSLLIDLLQPDLFRMYATLSAYIDLYIRQEVMMEGWNRNFGNFSRFLESISFSHGSILNLSNVSRECQVERKIVESYVTILEDLLM